MQRGFRHHPRAIEIDQCEVSRAARLKGAGIEAKQIRYSAICVHLDHGRGYVNDEDWRNNRVIRKTSIRDKLIETPAGIKQL